MMLVIGAIQLGVGERRIARRQPAFTRGAAESFA
jgi:hypothetical protein